jgi:hypothetical protein
MVSKKSTNVVEKEIFIGPKEYPIKIQIKTFNGRKYLDIRKWYLDRKTNEILPTKKGISLSEYQFEDVISIIAKEKNKISKWFQEKLTEEEVVDALVAHSEIRKKLSEEAKTFKAKSQKLTENKFFKIEYGEGKTQLILNENHQLYKEIDKKKNTAEDFKKIINILFVSFNQTFQLFDSDEKMKVADLEDSLMHNWSIILKNYIKKNG